MRSEQLEYLIEISKNKSMNATSQKLHISPQALSIAMKTLEKELNMLLLDRTKQGVELTENGKRLVEIAQQFFFDIDELQFGKLNSLNNENDILSFNFCLPFGFCEVWLPDIVEKIYEKFPQATIHATPCDYRDILQLVDSGEIPYGLTCKIFINGVEVTEKMSGYINFTPLFGARACALVPNNYPIKSNKTVSLKSMFDYSILSYEPSNYIFENIYYYYDDTNPKIINLPSVSAKNRLLAKGTGIAFGLYDAVSNQMLQEYPSNILVKTIREKIDIIFGYIINKNNTLSNDTISQLRFFDDFYLNK